MPGSPFGPCRPRSPFCPCRPGRSWPALKSAASSVPSFTLAPVTESEASLAPLTAFLASFLPETELFFSCAAPTEFFGSTSLPAAWPSGVAPNTATTRAVTATTVVSFDVNIVRLLLCELCDERRRARRPAEYGHHPSRGVASRTARGSSYCGHARRAVLAQR